jgi:hypothetical protein
MSDLKPLTDLFNAMRHDPRYHQGLGDIRLSVALQDEIAQREDALIERLEEYRRQDPYREAAGLAADARDEIERLRRELAVRDAEKAALLVANDDAHQEYNRVRRELDKARKLIEYAYDEMGGRWPAADEFLDQFSRDP